MESTKKLVHNEISRVQSALANPDTTISDNGILGEHPVTARRQQNAQSLQEVSINCALTTAHLYSQSTSTSALVKKQSDAKTNTNLQQDSYIELNNILKSSTSNGGVTNKPVRYRRSIFQYVVAFFTTCQIIFSAEMLRIKNNGHVSYIRNYSREYQKEIRNQQHFLDQTGYCAQRAYYSALVSGIPNTYREMKNIIDECNLSLKKTYLLKDWDRYDPTDISEPFMNLTGLIKMNKCNIPLDIIYLPGSNISQKKLPRKRQQKCKRVLTLYISSPFTGHVELCESHHYRSQKQYQRMNIEPLMCVKLGNPRFKPNSRYSVLNALWGEVHRLNKAHPGHHESFRLAKTYVNRKYREFEGSKSTNPQVNATLQSNKAQYMEHIKSLFIGQNKQSKQPPNNRRRNNNRQRQRQQASNKQMNMIQPYLHLTDSKLMNKFKVEFAELNKRVNEIEHDITDDVPSKSPYDHTCEQIKASDQAVIYVANQTFERLRKCNDIQRVIPPNGGHKCLAVIESNGGGVNEIWKTRLAKDPDVQNILATRWDEDAGVTSISQLKCTRTLSMIQAQYQAIAENGSEPVGQTSGGFARLEPNGTSFQANLTVPLGNKLFQGLTDKHVMYQETYKGDNAYRSTNITKGMGKWFNFTQNGKTVQHPTDKRFYVSFHHGLIDLPRECSVVIRQKIFENGQNQFQKLVVDRLMFQMDSSDKEMTKILKLKMPARWNWQPDYAGPENQAQMLIEITVTFMVKPQSELNEALNAQWGKDMMKYLNTKIYYFGISNQILYKIGAPQGEELGAQEIQVNEEALVSQSFQIGKGLCNVNIYKFGETVAIREDGTPVLILDTTLGQSVYSLFRNPCRALLKTGVNGIVTYLTDGLGIGGAPLINNTIDQGFEFLDRKVLDTPEVQNMDGGQSNLTTIGNATRLVQSTALPLDERDGSTASFKLPEGLGLKYFKVHVTMPVLMYSYNNELPPPYQPSNGRPFTFKFGTSHFYMNVNKETDENGLLVYERCFQCYERPPKKIPIHYKIETVCYNRHWTNLNLMESTRCVPEMVSEVELTMYGCGPPGFDLSLVIKAPPLPAWFVKQENIACCINFSEASELQFERARPIFTYNMDKNEALPNCMSGRTYHQITIPDYDDISSDQNPGSVDNKLRLLTMPGMSLQNNTYYNSLSNCFITELVGRRSESSGNDSGTMFSSFDKIFINDPGDPAPNSTHINTIAEICSSITPVITPFTGNMTGVIPNVQNLIFRFTGDYKASGLEYLEILYNDNVIQSNNATQREFGELILKMQELFYKDEKHYKPSYIHENDVLIKWEQKSEELFKEAVNIYSANGDVGYCLLKSVLQCIEQKEMDFGQINFLDRLEKSQLPKLTKTYLRSLYKTNHSHSLKQLFNVGHQLYVHRKQKGTPQMQIPQLVLLIDFKSRHAEVIKSSSYVPLSDFVMQQTKEFLNLKLGWKKMGLFSFIEKQFQQTKSQIELGCGQVKKPVLINGGKRSESDSEDSNVTVIISEDDSDTSNSQHTARYNLRQMIVGNGGEEDARIMRVLRWCK